MNDTPCTIYTSKAGEPASGGTVPRSDATSLRPINRVRLVHDASRIHANLSPAERYALRRVATGRGDAYDVEMLEDAVCGKPAPASWRGKRFDAQHEQAKATARTKRLAASNAITDTGTAEAHLAYRRSERRWKILGVAMCAVSATGVILFLWSVLG